MNTWTGLLIAVVSLMLAVLPGWGDARRMPALPWVLGWMAGIGAAAVLAFVAGAVHFDETVCATAGGDCDLGGLEGLWWAAATLVLLSIAWVADGVRRSTRTSRARRRR